MSDDGKIVKFPERKTKPQKPAVSERPKHKARITICQSSINATADIAERLKAGRLVGLTGLAWDPHEKTFSMWTNMPPDMKSEQAAAMYIGGLALLEEMLRSLASDAWSEARQDEDQE